MSGLSLLCHHFSKHMMLKPFWYALNARGAIPPTTRSAAFAVTHLTISSLERKNEQFHMDHLWRFFVSGCFGNFRSSDPVHFYAKGKTSD